MDSTEGSAHARERLKTVLLVMQGVITRRQAAERLGISVRRVRELRDTALGAAVASLEPGRPGRPPKERPGETELELRRLESAAEMLAWELDVSRTREELALLMPQLVRAPGEAQGKARASRNGRPSGAARRSAKRG